MKVDELGHKGHVGVYYCPFSCKISECIFLGPFRFEYEVSQTNSGTSRDTLHAMNVYLSILLFGFLYKEYGIVEYAFNVFPDMVLQIVILINNSIIFKIVGAIVSSTIHYMGDPQ